jgi:hypothetical protein
LPQLSVRKSVTELLTSKENIALNLISARLGESFINRTQAEYDAIAAAMPPNKVLHGWVNEALAKIAAAGSAPYEICYFKVGDRHHWYGLYPTSLSIEVIRSAVVRAGFRKKQTRKHPRKR